MRLWFFLRLWSLLWHLGLPLVLVYLWVRGRKDALYFRHLKERFGRYPKPLSGAIWIHAVSLGEMRSAVPLVRALLDRGDKVVTSHFTPAGRREAERVFAAEISAGQMAVVWVPFETSWAFRGFFRAFRPRAGLVMEIEIWPRMIFAARRARVPLYMCNAQYPTKSMARDEGFPLRHDLMRGFAGAFVKSDLQAERFASVGVADIEVTGELRFDQPIPPAQLNAAERLRPVLAADRRVVTFASVVEGEDGIYLDAIAEALASPPHRGEGLGVGGSLQLPASPPSLTLAHNGGREAPVGKGTAPGNPKPLFVYVPRKPERFDEVASLIAAHGLSFARRSQVLDARLTPFGSIGGIDLLLGDSLGEMYFYLALADLAVTGGGFTPHGAHNIIEPLALHRPVIVGPEVHTIEYPATEAIEDGVCLRVETPEELSLALQSWQGPGPDAIDEFFAEHAGATARTLAALDRRLTSR